MTGDSTGKRRPPVSAGWRWDETDAGLVLRAEALEPHAEHLFTTRNLQFRGHNPSADYEQLARVLTVAGDQVITVTQVHGRVVLVVRPGEWATEPRSADAIVSADPARAASVRIADCVPVLLADRRRRVVAAVHAGWRGTMAEVTRAAVSAIAELGVPASDLVAAIGPSIGPCCYQVDDPVRDAFLAARTDAGRWFRADADSRWKLDLWQANQDQLAEAGLDAAHVHVSRLCTFDHPSVFFSFRREGAGSGRMVAAIRAAR